MNGRPFLDKNIKECANCLKKETPLWRRSKNGENLCNACGLYARNHGKNRPVSYIDDNSANINNNNINKINTINKHINNSCYNMKLKKQQYHRI